MRTRYFYRPEHPRANERGFVSQEDLGDYAEEQRALDAPIMVDRFYENTSTVDGVDIGSRRKYRDYCKEHNVTNSADFKETWKKDAETRAKFFTEGGDHKERAERRETVARAWYELENRRGNRR